MKFLFLVSVLFLASACGSSYSDKGNGDAGDLSEEKQQQWLTTVKPIITRSCALSGCHATSGFVKTPEAFLVSKAKARITKTGAGKMPVPGSTGDRTFSNASKASVLEFFD